MLALFQPPPVGFGARTHTGLDASASIGQLRPCAFPHGNSSRIKRRAARKTTTMGASLAKIAFLVLMVGWCAQASSQVDRSAYRPSTVEEIIAQHGLNVESSAPAAKETHLIAPEFKYRLQLRATGRIRELTPDTVDAMSAWSQIQAGLPAFVNEYTHEVEVALDDRSVWLLWQRALVSPFRAERSGGGNIEAYAILAGSFRGKLLLFVTAFESLT